MDRSLYPSGVLVDSVALNRTELTKAAEILRNRTSWTTGGVLSGGAVTVNSLDNTRIDIATFSGFTPSGEFVENSAASLVSQPLASSVAGTVNYVLAVYTEDNTGSQAHETDGYSYPTKAEATYRLSILTESDYMALPDSDTILANDAKDRALVLAKITATGGALTSSDIESPTEFNNVLYTDPVQLSTISGVTIRSVSSDTAAGSGTLEFDDSGLPTYSFRWASNGAAYGAATTLTTDGVYTVTDSASNTIRIEVVASQLPIVGGATTETFNVYDLYNQAIPRISAEDHLHRNYTGTGIITTNNPHGTSFDDLYGGASGTLQEHQDVQHCNGIWRDSASFVFNGTVAVPHPSADVLTLSFPSSNNIYYVNGKKLNNLLNSSMTFDDASYGTGCDFYELYVDDDTIFKSHKKASFPSPRTVTGVWIVDMSKDHPYGNFTLSYTLSFGLSYFKWDNGREVFVDASPPAGVEGIIVRLYSEDGVNWVDLYVNRTASGPADAQLPGSSQSDTITVYNSLSRDENMQIISAPYWYDGVKGSIGIRTDLASYPSDTERVLIDKRIWGTLGKDQLADEVLEDLLYDPLDTFEYSGILYKREAEDSFKLDTSSLDATITGGEFYCRGRKRQFETGTLSLSDGKTHLLYIDYEGVLSSLNITDDYSGDPVEALKYVLGSVLQRPIATDEPYVSNDTLFAEKGVPLYIVTTSGGSITDYYDVSRNVNGPVDPWSVGQRFRSSLTPVAHYNAAFDSLAAAVDYIKVYNDLYVQTSYTIKCVGLSIVDRNISIPSDVRIVSTKGSYINVDYSDVTGVIKLEGSNYLEGLRVELLNSSDCSMFGIEGSDITFRDCTFNTGISGTHISNIFEVDRGVATTYNLVIDNCIIKTTHDVFYDTTVSTINRNFKIINSSIESSSSSNHYSSELVFLAKTYDLVIANNRFVRSNQNTTGSALELFEAYNCSINNNNFDIGTGTGSSIEGAIIIRTITESNISNNIFVTSSTTTQSNAINLTDAVKCVMCGNSISDYYMGLFMNDSGPGSSYGQNIIESNSMYVKKVGIAIENLSEDIILSNSIQVEDDTGVENLVYTYSLLSGVDQYASYGIVWETAADFSIEANKISMVGDSGDSSLLEGESRVILGYGIFSGHISGNSLGFNFAGRKNTSTFGDFPVLNKFYVDVSVTRSSFSIQNNSFYNNFTQAGVADKSGSLYVFLKDPSAVGNYNHSSTINVNSNMFYCNSISSTVGVSDYPYSGAVGVALDTETLYDVPYEFIFDHDDVTVSAYKHPALAGGVVDCSLSQNTFRSMESGAYRTPRVVIFETAGGARNVAGFAYKNLYSDGTGLSEFSSI